MRRTVYAVMREMRGIFLQKEVRRNKSTEYLFSSMTTLTYYGPEHDARNMRGDLVNLGSDMKKSVKLVETHFDLAL